MFEIVKKDIENDSIPPVYLWYGEDRYSLAEALKLLKSRFLADDPSGSGIELFSGKEVSWDEVVEAANTSSFFSRKLVVIDDMTYFKQSSEDNGGNEENADRLLAYCQNPNPSTCLVLISEKVNRGRKLYKEIKDKGKVLEFAYPKGQAEWQNWIKKETEAQGKKIDSATAAFLLEYTGHHTGILSQEIAKLAVYIGERQAIQKTDIEKVCTPLIETTVFSMLDAIASGNSRDALRNLQEVLHQEHYLKVHAMIVRQIRLLLAALLVRRKGWSVEKFITITGLRSSFEAGKIFRQAAGFSPKGLFQALNSCLFTEAALKNSGGDPNLLMEMMVVDLCLFHRPHDSKHWKEAKSKHHI